jgi:hypothetical protein
MVDETDIVSGEGELGENQETPIENPDDALQKRIEGALKPIKDKLDSAYSQRDEALARLAEIERKEKEEHIRRLKEEGKLKEAYEMQLAEERARREALEVENTRLSRDVEVRGILSGYEFRNDNAREMAYREIVGGLIKNESGQWSHRSGLSLRDFIAGFAASDENSFLFKPKVSSGAGGSSPSSPSNNSSGNKSLYEMSQEEVFKLAAEGKIPRR